MNTRRFSPWCFVAGLLCFFLPFFTVSCQQEKLAVIPGYRMITGFTGEQVGMAPTAPSPAENPKGPNIFGPPPQPAAPAANESSNEKNGPIIPAILDALIILVAAGLGFKAATGGPKAAIVAGSLAVAGHLALWIYVSNFWLASAMKSPPSSGSPADPSGEAFAKALMAQIVVSPSVGWYLRTRE